MYDNINVISLNESNLVIGIKSVGFGYSLEAGEFEVDFYDPMVVGTTYNHETKEFTDGEGDVVRVNEPG